MKYKCIKAFRNIPVGEVVNVYTIGGDMTIYINYNGLTIITNYATLIEHFEIELKWRVCE